MSITSYINKLYNEYHEKLHKNSNSICMYPECKNNCINSHIISKSKLKNISKKDHVIWFETNKLKGINNVFTYPIFCSEHDNNIFQSIDNNDYSIDNKQLQLQQNFLFFYRNYAGKYYRAKQKQKFICNNKQMTDGQNVLILSNAQNYEIYDKNLLNDTFFSTLTNNLLKKEYNAIESYVITFNKNYPICVGDFFDFDYNFQGEYIGLLNGISLTVFPQSNQTIAIISWNCCDSNNYRFIADNFNLLDKTTKKILLSMLILNGCQNIALSPDYWNTKFTNNEKQKLINLNKELNIDKPINLFRD